MANLFGIVGAGISGVALLFSILAVALNYWQTGKIGTSDVNAGLWEYCIENSGSKNCQDFDDTASDSELGDYRTVRAMVILGILLLTAAIVTTVIVMFVMKSMKMLFFVAAGLDLVAGLFLMVGFAVYDDKLKNSGLDLHAAFALDIIAWLLAWVAAGVFVGAKVLDKET